MKSKIFTIIFFIILVLSLGTIVSNAKIIASSNLTTVDSGETVKITVSSQELVDGYKVSISSNDGLTFVSATGGMVVSGQVVSGVSEAGTKELAVYTFTAPEVTKDTTYNVTFNVEGLILHDTEEKTTGSATAKVTVKAKEVPPTTVEPEPPVDNTTTEKPTEQKPETNPEPTFEEVNETVYATTSGVNVRESYSTSSKSIGTLKEGQEYTRTGKGSNDWSRISYNGKTAYVYSKYLTTTKPAEKPAEEKPQEEKKSDNANLKSLVVENHELIPSFSSSNTSYTMQVTNDITDLNITAEAEDEKATVSIKGEKDLKEGENIVTISVTAEDGTTIKNYEIKVTKLPEITLALQSLSIEGTDIEDEFEPNVFEYEIQFRELTKLNIEAVANEETAKVEIIGNEDLEEGENIITIMVTSEDELQTVTYQIKAKKLVTNTTTQEEKKSMDPNIYLYIAIGAVLLIALIIVIVYTIKNRKQEEFEEEENFEDFPGELPERQENTRDNNKENGNGRGRHF